MSELPRSWAVTTIAEVGEITTGNTPSKKEPLNYGGYCPWVKPPELNPTTPISVTQEGLSTKGASTARILPAGSVMVCCIGSLGKVGLAGVPLATNQQINSITFDERLVEPRYGFYYCQTLTNWLAENASATTISIVNKSTFSNAPFVCAPRNEQLRIVAEIEKQFTRLDDAVTALKRVQANLKRYRASVLKAACEGRLVPTEAELARKESRDYQSFLEQLKTCTVPRKVRRDVPERLELEAPAAKLAVPEGWSLMSVAELLRHGALIDVKDGNHGTNHPRRDEFSDSGLPFITAQQVENFRVDYEGAPKVSGDVLKRLRVGFSEPHDVILTHKGTIGRVAVATEKSVLTPQTTYYRVDHSVIDTSYLMYLLASPQSWSQLAHMKSQTTRDYVPISDQYKLFLLMPPVQEQKRIVAEVERHLSTTLAAEEAVKQRGHHSSSLRQSILKAAFSGKLVPQDPNDEPASTLLERLRKERAGTANGNAPKVANGTSSANGQRRRCEKKVAQRVSAGKS